MKVFAYLRVSTKEQASDNAFGLDSQLDAVESWEKRTGHTITKIYKDRGYSGSTQDRPQLQLLLQDVKTADVDAVVVPKFDRWARKTFLHLYLEKELKVSNVKLLSATEDSMNDDDPTTNFQRTIMSAMAEYEREMIKIRMQGGRKQKAKTGGHATGRTPYGYQKDNEGKLVIDPEEANVIRKMFQMRQDNNSLRAIARKLNDDGHRTKKGNKWRAKSVSYILKNGKYKGMMKQVVGGEDIETENADIKVWHGA